MTAETIQPAAPTEGLITKAEVAKRLKKTPRTIEYWQKKGIIPFVKINQSVLFNWPLVVKHLETHYGVNTR
jgi:hypothetical protein